MAKPKSGTNLKWWRTLTPAQQKAYLRKHPNSKYASAGRNRGSRAGSQDKLSDLSRAPKRKKGFSEKVMGLIDKGFRRLEDRLSR